MLLLLLSVVFVVDEEPIRRHGLLGEGWASEISVGYVRVSILLGRCLHHGCEHVNTRIWVVLKTGSGGEEEPCVLVGFRGLLNCPKVTLFDGYDHGCSGRGVPERVDPTMIRRATCLYRARRKM